ncbi:hypothetical protein QF039_001981 [Pseudomonas sp. W2I6]|nr:hypothetical protein [Pseudomonas sp. W2I6]
MRLKVRFQLICIESILLAHSGLSPRYHRPPAQPTREKE